MTAESQVHRFLREMCAPSGDSEVPVGELYEMYVRYAESHGWRGVDRAYFGRVLLRDCPGVYVVKRGPKGAQVRRYVGVMVL